MRLNKFLLKKLEREFPFLKKINLVQDADETHLVIRKADSELLAEKYVHHDWWSTSRDDWDGGHNQCYAIGEKIYEVEIPHNEGGSLGECILESIPDKKYCYILLCQRERYDNGGIFPKTVKSWTLYKKVDSEELLSTTMKIQEKILQQEMRNLLDLEAIMKKMANNDPSVLDNHGQWRTDLPVSGPEPADQEKPVWSWTENQVLVGFSADDLEIIDR